MSDPRIGSSSSNVSIPNAELEQVGAPRAPPQVESGGEPKGNAVESWSGSNSAPIEVGAQAGTLTAAEYARDLAQGGPKSAVMGLGEAFQKMAHHHVSPREGGFTDKEANFLEAQLGHADVQNALGKLSRETVEGLVMGQVHHAWPKANPDEVQAMTANVMTRLSTANRDNTAFALQKLATSMMNDGARAFEVAAGDSKQLQSLSEQLNALSKTNPEQAELRREALGVEGHGPVTAQSLASALRERAALMRREAKDMGGHGPGTLFRALQEQDLAKPYLKTAGIEPGSFASRALEQVKEKGESDARAIESAKYVSSLIVIAGSGGLGAGGLAAFVAGQVGNAVTLAPELALAWKKVDTARASESAGTMKEGSGHAAKTNAQLQTVVAVGSSVIAGGIASSSHHAVDHFATKVAQSEVAQGLVKGLVHAAIDKGTEAVGEGLAHPFEAEAEGEATGRNALER